MRRIGLNTLCLLALALAVPGLMAQTIGGVAYMPLESTARYFGMDLRASRTGSTADLSSQWTRLRFRLHKRAFTLNGIEVHLGDPVAEASGRLLISRQDHNETLRPILTPHTFPGVPKLYRIVIDPGHGGRDPGAMNRSLGIDEATTVYDVARRLQRDLEAYGYRVTLTRGSDEFVELSERARLASQVGADLFISLHFNAFASSRVHGVETYIMTPQGQPSTSAAKVTSGARRRYRGNANDPWNALVGYYVHRSLVSDLDAADRGLRRARFQVLREITCPGLLVEGGFVSNPAEGRRIASSGYRADLARSILSGVLDYQKALNRVRSKPGSR